jgi:hypothetical protein
MPMGWTKVADKNYYILRLCRPFLDEVIAKTEWRSHSGSYFQELLVDSVDQRKAFQEFEETQWWSCPEPAG